MDITNSIKTKLGREKLAKALSGDASLPPITHIVFGNGGTENGVPKKLTGNEIQLFNQIIKKSALVEYPITTTTRFIASIDADTDGLVGKVVNEVGLIDSAGSLIAMKTFTDKTLDSETLFEVFYDVVN